MGAKALAKANVEEIKRLKGLGLSERAIGRALKIHRLTVRKYLAAEEPVQARQQAQPDWIQSLDWQEVIAELQRGVPVNVIWQEESESGRVPVQYPAFWKQLKRRFPNLPKSMHRVFAPGERIEIDYCDGIEIYDRFTGDMRKTQLFVGVLCNSRYAFAEFSFTQKSEDFLSSHKRMFEFFGGVSQVVSPDNLKSAVTKAHRYDPVINPAYTRLAEHYDFAVVPARVRRPKDKAIVERTIQIFQRWFFFRVRKRRFTSLAELNQCLREHLDIFHAKKHRIFRRARAEMFAFEKEHLRPLPETPYDVATHHKAALHPDCHLAFDKNYYSAPYTLRGEKLDVWATLSSVEIYHNGKRVAFHPRSKTRGKFITDKHHYPKSHLAYCEATPKYLRNQASKLGYATSKLVHAQLTGDTPLRYLRRVQGIIRLGDKYGKEALNRACEIAIEFNRSDCLYLERLLKKPGLLKPVENPLPKRNQNELLRGEELYH